MTSDQCLTHETMTLNLRNPFGLSYGVTSVRYSHWIRLAGDAGWGEGAIPPYYGISTESMVAYWDRMSARRDPLPTTIEEIEPWMDKDGPAPARCAVEMALYDYLARQAGLPLYRFLGMTKPEGLLTSFTVAMTNAEEMAELARQASNHPIIKIKMGGEHDRENLLAIRAARPDARLMIDANAGWTREQALAMLPVLEENGVELVEQPLVKDDIAGLGLIQKHTRLPVVADEALQSVADFEAIAAAGVQGINLKLMKLGGISVAVNLMQRAHKYGMRIMLGQMIETSLATTAMAHLSGGATWADLDSPLLISNDPFTGIAYTENGTFTVTDQPGLGVTRKS